jgi:hypothetical protein
MLAADKGYDTRDFVADIRFAGITPHVAQNVQARRRSAIDGRTARHQGYSKSINARKRIEQVFGWIEPQGFSVGVAGCGIAAAQGQGPITGGSRVPSARGGLQPDPPGQPAQPSEGNGMKRAVRGNRGRFSAPRAGKMRTGIARLADRTPQMAPTIAAWSRTSATALG